nr:immunoglobulin light chain junction region [Macaca mulatta]
DYYCQVWDSNNDVLF